MTQCTKEPSHFTENSMTTIDLLVFVAFVEDNATMSSVPYFENRVSYFVQNRRKQTPLNSFLYDKHVFW